MGQLYVVIRHNMVFERLHQVEVGEILIGRDKDCGLYLADLHVSRKHALLLNAEHGCQIRDLGSHNGTRVNGRAINCDKVLNNGAEVEIGPFLLNVCMSISEAVKNTVHTDDSTQSGGFPVAPDGNLESKIPPLTPAQRRVYDLFLEGLIEKEVAHRLGITLNTVHGHAKEIYKALSVSTRGELILRGTVHL